MSAGTSPTLGANIVDRRDDRSRPMPAHLQRFSAALAAHGTRLVVGPPVSGAGAGVHRARVAAADQDLACPKCGQEQPAKTVDGKPARFCSKCGAPLEARTSTARARVPTGARRLVTSHNKPRSIREEARALGYLKEFDSLANAATLRRIRATGAAPSGISAPGRSIWSLTPRQQAAFKRSNPKAYATAVANMGPAALETVRREGPRASLPIREAARAHDADAYTAALRAFYSRSGAGPEAA